MLAPRSLGGTERRRCVCVWGGYTSLCLGDLYHQLGKGYARIFEEEEEWSRGLGGLLGTTYFKSRSVPYHPLLLPRHPHPLPLAPPRSVVAFVIVIWPCLLNASTVYSAL